MHWSSAAAHFWESAQVLWWLAQENFAVVANCRCLLFSPDDTTPHSPHQAMCNIQPAAGNSIGAGSVQAKA